METRTYWMSFADETKPKGQQFLGVVILDVTDEEARSWIKTHGWLYPARMAGAEWNGAAMVKAHRLKINPGGQIMYVDITHAPTPAPLIKNKLLSAKELAEAGLA